MPRTCQEHGQNQCREQAPLNGQPLSFICHVASTVRMHPTNNAQSKNWGGGAPPWGLRLNSPGRLRPKGVLDLVQYFPLSTSTTSLSYFYSLLLVFLILISTSFFYSLVLVFLLPNFCSHFSKFGISNSEFVISGRSY